jgi:Tol biopolymer transport system component
MSRTAHAQFAPVTWITRDTLARDWWPRVGPDGRTITFSRSRDGGATYEMMRTTIAGDPARPFFAKPPVGSATRGAWSKRHRRFAFTGREREDDDSAAVWIADAAGARAERLPLRWPSASILYPIWMPDEHALIAQDFGTSGGPMLVEIDLRTGAVTPITDPKKMFAAGSTLSPDGEWIAFVGQWNEGQLYDQLQNHMWLMRRRGGEPPREISAGQGRQPDWSPDGR